MWYPKKSFLSIHHKANVYHRSLGKIISKDEIYRNKKNLKQKDLLKVRFSFAQLLHIDQSQITIFKGHLTSSTVVEGGENSF